MNGLVARDPRVLAILTAPDDYFASVRRRAWIGAGEDIASDLARRARRRRDAAVHLDTWPPVVGDRRNRPRRTRR
jgi:hypothetical protein